MTNEQAMKLIDAEVEKWTSRKVWIQKCDLEGQVESLQNQVSSLEYENKKLKDALNRPELKGYNPGQNLYDVERDFIIKTVKAHGNNKTQAAEALGITIKSLYNKLHEYGEFENLRRTIV